MLFILFSLFFFLYFNMEILYCSNFKFINPVFYFLSNLANVLFFKYFMLLVLKCLFNCFYMDTDSLLKFSIFYPFGMTIFDFLQCISHSYFKFLPYESSVIYFYCMIFLHLFNVICFLPLLFAHLVIWFYFKADIMCSKNVEASMCFPPERAPSPVRYNEGLPHPPVNVTWDIPQLY